MAHGDQLGSTLGGGNAGESRHLQRIPLGILRKLFQHRGLDLHECLGSCRATGLGLRGYIHHACPAFFVVMGEFFHLRRTRIMSPAAQDSRSGSVTRKAFARDKAPRSPDPCHGSGATVDPSAESCAGRNRVRPVLWRRSFDSLACNNRKGASLAPPNSSTAARANTSNVTMVDAGFPGSPKKNVSRTFPNTSGCP